MHENNGKESLAALFDLVKTLRSESGCPWDRKQNHKSLKKYLLEEAAEVADCIDSADSTALCDELGDLLFQIVFHCSIAEDNGDFSFKDIASGIIEKMKRRHPHVFGDEKFESAEDLSRRWNEIKAQERALKKSEQDKSALSRVARNLPVMMRSDELQKAASKVGFDWPDRAGVLEKIHEEVDELAEVIKNEESPERRHEEFGDLLFSVVNLARFVGVDSRQALADTNSKFERRFRKMESALKDKGKDLSALSIDEMEEEWGNVKKNEQSDKL